MRSLLFTIAAVMSWIILAGVPAAAPAGSPAEPAVPTADEMMALFQAYQGGFMQVVAVSMYQIYYSTGIIATDFAQGHIDGDTAVFAIQRNSLLLSACITTVTRVLEVTPAADQAVNDELKTILAILNQEDALVQALGDACSKPSPETAAAVESNKETVAQSLEAYSKSFEQ